MAQLFLKSAWKASDWHVIISWRILFLLLVELFVIVEEWRESLSNKDPEEKCKYLNIVTAATALTVRNLLRCSHSQLSPHHASTSMIILFNINIVLCFFAEHLLTTSTFWMKGSIWQKQNNDLPLVQKLVACLFSVQLVSWIY